MDCGTIIWMFIILHACLTDIYVKDFLERSMLLKNVTVITQSDSSAGTTKHLSTAGVSYLMDPYQNIILIMTSKIRMWVHKRI